MFLNQEVICFCTCLLKLAVVNAFILGVSKGELQRLGQLSHVRGCISFPKYFYSFKVAVDADINKAMCL